MVDLVSIKNGEAMTDSIVIAEKFGKSHKRVLESIDRLINNMDLKWDTKTATTIDKDFKFSEKSRTYRGQSFRYIEMNREAFIMLVSSFTGKKAVQWRTKFVIAFKQMSLLLSNYSDLGWRQVRADSKDARLEFTGCIKQFVEYATSQGSKSANKYYITLTKMEYAALRMIEYREKVPSNFRDTLDRMQLFMLVMAEHVANETIKQGMDDKLHYKEIFLLSKQAVLKYAESVLFDKKQIKQRNQ